MSICPIVVTSPQSVYLFAGSELLEFIKRRKQLAKEAKRRSYAGERSCFADLCKRFVPHVELVTIFLKFLKGTSR